MSSASIQDAGCSKHARLSQPFEPFFWWGVSITAPQQHHLRRQEEEQIGQVEDQTREVESQIQKAAETAENEATEPEKDLW
mmetsp:Transcript_46329/g.72528  ORF Transcript_46329/g.72528 Transcript_46329/m.72528 type:complete len:81 (-) Transcript_46329:135-377(-)